MKHMGEDERILQAIRSAHRRLVASSGLTSMGSDPNEPLLPVGVEILLLSLPQILQDHPRYTPPGQRAPSNWLDADHVQFVINNSAVAMMVYSAKDESAPLNARIDLASLMRILSKAYFEYIRLRAVSR